MSGQDVNRGAMNPEAAGIFRGFNIQYPEYSVVTPQTGLSFGVRGLTVSEVNKLKSSSMTPSKSTDLINRTIWGSLVNKPDEIETFEQFMASTTLKDRESLIFGIYVTSFGDEREFNVTCGDCGTERPLKILMSEIIKVTPFPGTDAMASTYEVQRAGDSVSPDPVMDQVIEEKQVQKQQTNVRPSTNPDEDDPVKAAANAGIGFGDNSTPRPAPIPTNPVPTGIVPKPTPKDVNTRPEGINIDPGELTSTQQSNVLSTPILGKEISVTLPVSKIVAIIHQPTIQDEHSILNEISFARREDTELVNETLVISRFEVYSAESRQPVQTVTRREDIIKGYQSLPVLDKKEIYKHFRDNFAEYGIELEAEWDCFECGTSNTLSLDIVTQFFRMVAVT